MNAVVKMSTPINAATTVEAEELGVVKVLGSMFFHVGYSRELEIENQNPSSPTTKVYVMLEHRGPYIANAVEDPTALGGIRLTHLQKLESIKGFVWRITRMDDRADEGFAFLDSAWSMV